MIFVEIQNRDIPIEERSFNAEKEIQNAIEECEITHVITIHEQLARGDSYLDPLFRAEFSRKQYGPIEVRQKSLDPFVPPWVMEQFFFSNRITPQLQHAMNERIKKLENLILSTGTN